MLMSPIDRRSTASATSASLPMMARPMDIGWAFFCCIAHWCATVLNSKAWRTVGESSKKKHKNKNKYKNKNKNKTHSIVFLRAYNDNRNAVTVQRRRILHTQCGGIIKWNYLYVAIGGNCLWHRIIFSLHFFWERSIFVVFFFLKKMEKRSDSVCVWSFFFPSM